VEAHPPDTSGAVITAGFVVPFWIRAHFVRHRPIAFADDMFRLLGRDDVLDLTIAEPVTIEVAASADIWRQLLGSRSCWLTQSVLYDERDPWDKIVDEFGVSSLLPCSHGICPHHRDARNRLEGTDTGVPCVRYSLLNDIDISPFRDAMRDALRSRGLYWHAAFAEAENRWPASSDQPTITQEQFDE
jgi:hypothetical protein